MNFAQGYLFRCDFTGRGKRWLREERRGWIQAVSRADGSSQVPAFLELRSKKFGRDRIKESILFTTIFSGLEPYEQELSMK